MTRITKSIQGGLFGLALLLPSVAAAEPNTGGGPTTHDCAGVAQTCGTWGAKGANTCRTCQQAQCKTENGKDVLAGNKTTTECYEGHGSPPAPSGSKPPKVKVPKTTTEGLKKQKAQ